MPIGVSSTVTIEMDVRDKGTHRALGDLSGQIKEVESSVHLLRSSVRNLASAFLALHGSRISLHGFENLTSMLSDFQKLDLAMERFGGTAEEVGRKMEIEKKVLSGDSIQVQLMQAAEEGKKYTDRLNAQMTELDIGMQEISDKIVGIGKKPTPEALQALEESKARYAEMRKVVEESLRDIQVLVEKKQEEIKFLSRMDVAASTSRYRLETVGVTGTTFERLEEEKAYLEVQKRRAQFAARRDPEEYDAVTDYFETKQRYNTFLQQGSMLDGFGERFDEMNKRMQTNAQVGMQVADSFAGAWGNAFSNMVTGAKDAEDAFVDMGTSILAEVTRIMSSRWLIQLLGSVFGGSFPGPGTMQTSTVSPGMANAGVAHSGLMVGQPASSNRFVPVDMFFSAPRLHSGLAADEFPAILQTGEEVVSRSDRASIRNQLQAARGGSAVTVNLVNNTGVQASARKGSEGPRWDGKKWVQDIVLEAVNGGNESLMYAIANLK